MSEYQDRVIEEETELSIKIDKLDKFRGTDTYGSLDKEEQVLMDLQLLYMKAYRDVLSRRIIRF